MSKKIPKYKAPTDEELQARIERLNVLNKWTKQPEGPEEKEIPLADHLSYIKNNIQLLENLGDLLQKQVDADVKKIDEAREKIERLKHGGGV